ncbi:probable N-acetyltransferase CML1 [Cynoglossus semilaevis]|uniref:N-acetyltransferase 8 n=1 Tax=Cynoglossus semilaevis TaxID=244447 RepID=A0A3P8VQP0_CYNSE|nr:probable N-acetyltransferase CML1 [Cynoglossus semilaevis]XP_024912016.1 probable N-acetyltransferase CML1 [Cynoglossus semilaevis]
MRTVQVRKYQCEDEERVKEIFTLGMSEHVPALFRFVLKQPLSQVVFMCTFCALLTISKSFLLPFVVVTLMVAGVRMTAVYMSNQNIKTCLRRDLNDITENYMKQTGACFWVAETDGRVVATVACRPNKAQPGCLELKRVSVLWSHRRMGIAKALIRTVVDFTRDRGYAAVILQTAVIQTDAHRLYEAMGFQKIREVFLPETITRIINFTLFEYRLDLQR